MSGTRRFALWAMGLWASGCATTTGPAPRHSADAATATVQADATATACDDCPQPVSDGAPCPPPATPVPPGFAAVDAPQVLERALGAPGKGGLCSGTTYRVDGYDPLIFRAYNSTNPRSRLGSWWSLSRPSGSVAQYRSNFEICYQWSPLDTLVQCRIRAGAVVAFGPGQSAWCSEFLQYGPSAAVQLYVDSAEDNLYDCTTQLGVFRWQPAAGEDPSVPENSGVENGKDPEPIGSRASTSETVSTVTAADPMVSRTAP